MQGSVQHTNNLSSLHAGRVWIFLSFAAIVVISTALIALTFVITRAPETVPLEWQWNLRWEHNFAAWWTGSLLALGSVLAMDNAARSDQPALRRAWLTFSMIILFLSLDEIGSLHERMGMVSLSFDAGRWAIAIPVALVIGFLCVRSGWTLLMHGGQERVQVFILAAGFSVFLAVAAQEYLEHAIDWEQLGLKAWRAVFEEGSELLGVAVVLIAVGLPLLREPSGAFASLSSYAHRILIGAVVLAFPALAISADLDPERGYPSDWLASALLLGAALIWVRRFWTSGPRITSLLLAGLCILASLGTVAMGYADTFLIAGVEVSRRAVIYLVLAAILAAAMGWRAASPAVVVALALAIAGAFATETAPLWTFGLCSVFGAAVFWASNVNRAR